MKKEKITVDDIVKLCGGTMELAHTLQLNYNTILAWKRKKDIPKRYWAALIKLTKDKVDLEDLYFAS